ncbi:MAG TPA: GDSL-type esterase/lipase family protein [Vicinamibacteria bacterium]|jgi:lysophospholipase L1-like esterase
MALALGRSGRKGGGRARVRLALGALLCASLFVLHLQARWLNATAAFLLLAAGGLLAALAVELAASSWTAAARGNARVLVGATVLAAMAAEATLRSLGRHASYTERNGGHYRSLFRMTSSNRYNTYPPGRTLRYHKVEFEHLRAINSLGLTGPEPVVARQPREFRVVALGDSFTEGVGTGPESTWVIVAQRALGARHPGLVVTSLNAGISASDPVFQLALLRERLLPFRPDLVVLAVNTSDIDDLVVRGGSERFRPDGTVAVRPPPRWDWIYGSSFLFRVLVHDVVGYDWTFVRPRWQPSERRRAAAKLKDTVAATRTLCRENGAGFLLVSHPLEHELRARRYSQSHFAGLVEGWRADASLPFLDLLEAYLAQGLIPPERSADFYWARDLHHNTRGYAVMGSAIAARILELGLVRAAPSPVPAAAGG